MPTMTLLALVLLPAMLVLLLLRVLLYRSQRVTFLGWDCDNPDCGYPDAEWCDQCEETKNAQLR